MDLEKCIGEFEFGLVPRSLFAADGTLLLASDMIREQLEGMMKAYQEMTEKEAGEGNVEKDDANVLEENIDDAILSKQCSSSSKRMIIIDGMALLNSVVCMCVCICACMHVCVRVRVCVGHGLF